MGGGLDRARLDHLRATIAREVDAGLYFGARIIVARHGEIGLDATIGHADEAASRPVETDSVFSIFSMTKAMTNILALRAIELGRFSLTTRVHEVIPEFGGGLRAQINVYHLLTHMSGLPMIFQPRAGMNLDILADVVAALCETVHAVEPPGERCNYSPMANQLLLGEMVRRTDPAGRAYRDIVQEDLFAPLGMTGSAIGVRADLKERHLFPEFRGLSPIEHRGSSNLGPNGAYAEEKAEMPWVGAVSTAPDIFRLAEMLRREGSLDGARILSPATVRLSRRNQTGDKPNELYKMLAHKRLWEPAPAYIGLGFSLRGERIVNHMFGTLTSPETFGNYGSGTTLFWVDPALDMTFVCLSTGLLEPNENIVRFQRLSDIAVSAAD
ncbi:MAG TPA: serine hydrolase domain-containing protein [Allosphingosinicella sp.]|nr:serine hydrolase domain-containing protein [Allosphingosinicella sp.]